MKKRFLKKSVVLLFALSLLLGLSINTYAADTYTSGNWTYQLASNGLTITGYSGTEATVVIPETLDGYKVGIIGKHAFLNNTTMRTVTIPETITYIGPEAFYGCSVLSQINYNAKNCTVPEIWRYDGNKGVGVFSGAGSAAVSLNVTFGDKVSDIPKDLFNTDSENGYDYAHVTSITFSDKVKTIGVHAFANCKDLEELNLGKNVTIIKEYAFYECISMEEAAFNDELTEIHQYAFNKCTNLEEINWGNGLDSIGAFAFADCTSLEEAHIPEPTSVLGNKAFASCTSLEEITIPVTMTKIGAEVFYNALKLSQINYNAETCTIPEIWRYDGNKGVGVFSGAGSGARSMNVTFGSKVTDIPKDLFNTDYENNYDYAHLTSITFSSAVKTVGTHAFANCRDLEKITFGKNVTTLNEYAFYDCVSLEKVTFNDKLAAIGKYAFHACTNLEEIDWGTGLDVIGACAFKGCTSLEEANIPEPTTVIDVQAFMDCTSLKKITIPVTVTSINAEAFYNTTKLSQINYNAETCTIPEIWRYDGNKGVGVFSGAGSGTNAVTVTFGSKVVTIPANLFNTDKENGYDHAYITTVTIPSNVKEIGASAFEDCIRLDTVSCKSEFAVLGENVYKNCANNLTVTAYYGGTTAVYADENGLECIYLKPTMPTLKSVSNVAKGIKLQWKRSAGTQKYVIYRKTSSTGSWAKYDEVKAGTTSYTDDDAKAGKVYYYTVKAYAPKLYSEYDGSGLKLERLKAPTSVTVTNKVSSIYVKWNKATGANRYIVYRSKGTGAYKKVTTTSNAYYTDKNISNGTKYRYKIYAYDSNNGSQSVASSVKTIYRLSKPSVKSLTSPAAGKMTVKWAKNNSATGYKVQYSLNSSFKNAKTVTISGKATLSKTITKLTKNKKYYVKVCTLKKVSGTTYTSAWSDVKTVKVKK